MSSAKSVIGRRRVESGRPAASPRVRPGQRGRVSGPASGGEGRAAAAALLGVRVTEPEAAARQGLDVVELGALEVLRRHRVDEDPHPLDLDLIASKFGDPSVRADLDSIGIEDPFHFLAHVLLVEQQVTSFVGEGPLVTDDHTYLDFSVARSKESSFGTGNQATGNWLSELLEPGSRENVALAIFFRRINELMAFKQPVMPHLVNVEAAGFDPGDASVRIESFSRPGGRAGL